MNWKEIWENRDIEMSDTRHNNEELLAAMIKANGFDHPGLIVFEDWMQWFKELRARKYAGINSIYEAGCGAGAFLYFFADLRVGGCDYSEKLIEFVKKYIPSDDFSVIDVSHIEIKPTYDNVSSFSVMQYLDSFKAINFLNRSLRKAKSVFLFDIPDAEKKTISEAHRSILGMKESKHSYYSKQFFIDYAKKNFLRIEIEDQSIKNYANSPHRFNIFLYK